MPEKFSHADYEIIQREVLHKSIFCFVRYHLKHKLFNGGWSEVFKRELLERFSAAAVLPYDPVLDRVILIEQFRPGSLSDPESPWLLEIPAGVIVNDEPPMSVAHHEAEEEAGCTATELIPICEYFARPGGSNEYVNLYCGKTNAKDIGGIHGLKIEHEDIRVHNLTVDAALEKLYSGKIKTSPAIIALLWLQNHRARLRTVWD